MLQWFTGENLRCVEKVELKDLKRLNVFEGRNGAGKTSILEGMHVLGRGRSFRTARLSELQRKGTEFLRVVGATGSPDSPCVIGVERRGRISEFRVAGARAERASVLASRLPQLVIRPESQELVSGASEGRRKLLDWVLFHVEQHYGERHARFRRVLQQRNSALRSGANTRTLAAWEQEFLEAAEAIHAARATFFGHHGTKLCARIAELVGFSVSVEYKAGWDTDVGLEAELAGSIERDRSLGFSSRGPHRGDLVLGAMDVKARSVLSRGESKLTVLGLLLGLADVVKELGIAPVLLVDDLASELDQFARERFFAAVDMTQCQTFVSTVDVGLIPDPWRTQSAVFHVEQGTVDRVL